jgi:hypothetical protein
MPGGFVKRFSGYFSPSPALPGVFSGVSPFLVRPYPQDERIKKILKFC